MFGFDWNQYLENYPDLKRSGIDNSKKAERHYRVYGKKEGRNSLYNLTFNDFSLNEQVQTNNKYLVYFTVGFSFKYIDLLQLAIESFQYFNKDSDVDVVVICDECMEKECKEKLRNVILISVPDSSEAAYASINKLKLFEFYPEAIEYISILFIDSDIITHTNVKPILQKISKEDTLYVYTEFTDINYHLHAGWSCNNYNESEISFFKENSIFVFNAGCFGFRPGFMKSHFKNITDTISLYKKKLVIYEQSFMNVYFNKLNNTDRTLLTSETYIMWPNKNTDYSGKLVHFCGNLGNGDSKYPIMLEYTNKYIKQIKTINTIIELCKKYSMITTERFLNNINSVKLVEKNNIQGDIVEIGVWKGGSMLSMILASSTEREFYLYDTFEGMTEPTVLDKDYKNVQASDILNKPSIKCLSTLDEVKKNIYTHVKDKKIHFIKGDILLNKTFPSKIAVLRLDTDWYESTKYELEIFYPLVSEGGVVIIDDYGHWEGCKIAVDEFIKDRNINLIKIDYTGVYFIKNTTKILVLMCDNRALNNNYNSAEYWSLTAQINKKYCDKHGYSFTYIQPYYKEDTGSIYTCADNLGNLRHSAWAKILLLKLKLESFPAYDYVVYIDTDCIIKDHNIKLEDIIGSNDLLFQSSAPYHPKLPCCGFIVCKNTPENHKFLDMWYNYPVPASDSEEWQNVMKVTNEMSNYTWDIGKHWEQDILWSLVVNNKTPKFKMLDENSCEENDNQFTRHIYHTQNNLRTAYFKKKINQFVPIKSEKIDTSTLFTF